MDYVLDHPFGVGVGRAKEERIEATGDVVASDVKVISRTWYARCLESFNSRNHTFSTLFENKFNLYLLSFMFLGTNNQSCSYAYCSTCHLFILMLVRCSAI
jgi:hypothetical protein